MINKYTYFSYLFLVSLLSLNSYVVPSLDPYHTGEYLVQLINLENGLNTFTIHGAVNYAPAFMSKFFFGDDYIVATPIFIRALAIASSLLLTHICYLLLNKNKNKIIISLFIFSISLSFISHRDVFLMLSILYFIKILNLTSSHVKVSTIHLILFGLVMTLTLFWTFDRGIAGLVSIGIAYIYLLYKSKDYRLIVPIASFLFSLTILSVTFNPTSIFHWFDNVLMLINSSGQWQYTLSFFPIFFASLAFILLLFTIFNILQQAKGNSDYIYKTHLIFIFLLSIILFKSAVNRADLAHIFLTLTGVFLSTSLILGRESKINYTFINAKLDFIALASFCTVFFVLGVLLKNFIFLYSSLMFAFIFIIQHGGKYLHLNKILAVMSLVFFVLLSSYQVYRYTSLSPLNQESSNGVHWAAQVLILHNEECIFDLTNSGVINALSNLPTCTKYSYPVYAPYKDEQQMLKQLKESNPNFIVYSSTFWAYTIDGKSMAIRYPKVDGFIKSNYGFSQCKFDYCIKSKSNF